GWIRRTCSSSLRTCCPRSTSRDACSSRRPTHCSSPRTATAVACSAWPARARATTCGGAGSSGPAPSPSTNRSCAPPAPRSLGSRRPAEAGMSSKVVAKRDAAEKVGVLGRVDGVRSCIEYSDLPAELREQREADGGLRFRAGNIAVHALSVAFLERVTRGGLE